jgi:preprotein translocase subunit YajC
MPLDVVWGTPARLAAAQKWTQQQLGAGSFTSGEPEGNAVLIAAQPSSGGGGLTIWIMMGLLFLVMYFLMIRPQQRRRREAEAMQSAMGPGDEVVTVGGLYGTIQSLDDETVLLEIAPDVVARYARPAISRVITPADQQEDAEDGTEDEDDDEEQVSLDKAVDSD